MLFSCFQSPFDTTGQRSACLFICQLIEGFLEIELEFCEFVMRIPTGNFALLDAVFDVCREMRHTLVGELHLIINSRHRNKLFG